MNFLISGCIDGSPPLKAIEATPKSASLSIPSRISSEDNSFCQILIASF